jgi:DNA-directed RNA polymerase specialized sigma24 family protein
MELSLEDIKQELKDYFCNQTIIDEYEKSNGKIEDLYDRATKTTTTISDMPKGNSEVMDRAAESIAEIVDLQQENMKLEKEYAVGLMKLKNTNLIVHKTIMSLDNPYRTVLLHIYEYNKTREELAEILDRSKRWIDKLLGYSLLRYLKERNKNIKNI